jgi:uncharacterized membrane protein YhhN
LTAIFLLLFIIDAILHLIAIVVHWEWPRRISKALIVPLLLGYYAAGTEHFLFTVFLAGILGWLGDIFLIIRTNKIDLFYLGLLSFLLGHLCYIRSLLYFTETVSPAALIIVLIIAIPLAVVIFRFIRPEKDGILPLVVYGSVLMGTAISAYCFMLSRGDLPGVMIFAGGICFLVSDVILGYGHFRQGARIRTLPVMITYITAQACLILGLAQV